MIMQRPTSGPVPASKVLPFIGLDQAFNAAVNHIAGRLWPRGYNLTSVEIDSLELLQYWIKARNSILSIWSGASDPELTIWGCCETNYAFRAWHDWHRLKLDAPFNLDGEIAVAHAQAEDLINLYGMATSRYWRKLLEAEVVGQAQYRVYHGQFPKDQKSFTFHRLVGGLISRVFH